MIDSEEASDIVSARARVLRDGVSDLSSGSLEGDGAI